MQTKTKSSLLVFRIRSGLNMDRSTTPTTDRIGSSFGLRRSNRQSSGVSVSSAPFWGMDNGRGGGGRGWRGRGGGRPPWRWMYKKRGANGYQGGRGRGGQHGSPGDSGVSSADSSAYRNGEGQDDQNSPGRGGDDSAGAPRQGSSLGGGGGWGWGRGGGRWNNFKSNRRNDDETPPRKKKRTDAVQTIKASVEKAWRSILPGYDLYYGDGPPQLPETEKKIAAVEQYLLKTGFLKNVAGCETTRDGDDAFGEEQAYFTPCYEDVIRDEEFCNLWPEFGNDLVDEPEQSTNVWSATAHKVLYNAMLAELQAGEDASNDSQPQPIAKIRMGFFKSGPVTPLISLKADHIGKFVTIRGAVVSAGNVRPVCTRLTFKCKFCEEKFTVKQVEGKYTYPSECKATLDCSNTFSFEPLETAPTTVMQDSRRIKVQDVLHCDIERGTVPKTIECVLFGCWADLCNTGDLLTLSGIVKMSGLDKALHHNYIEVSAIRQQKESEGTMGGHLFSFTDKDYLAVKEIHDTANLFRLLIASLCPAIYGHELVKAGLLLCLFSGTLQRGEGMVSRRSDINMLMIGDPGIGKSQMLKVITDVAPKAVYVCGTGSTVAGLTVALVKDGDDYSMEAGALVIADNGICCIDEFDKMSHQHHALLEAMEQQSVSVAKSGVHRTLPARATVIAAANPVGGHYNSTKTVTENIKINPAILSRFDLIFILLDKPNEEFDRGLVAHKVALRMGVKHSKATHNPVPGHSGNVEDRESYRLIDRIKVQNGEIVDIIPHSLLRKYIAYAKEYVHPKLSKEACEILKKYYLNLRVSRRAPESTPITARQLESLVRLSQARAKIELREEVTAEDANDVLEIFEFSLSSAYDDEVMAMSALSDSVLLNSSGIGSSSSKKPKSLQGQAKQLLSALEKQSVQQSKNLFSVDEIKRITAALGYKEKSEALIDTLNNMTFLLHKGGRTYQLTTQDF